MLELPSGPLQERDPRFERLALDVGELTYALPGLGYREKLLLCLAGDVCRGHLGLALRLHVQALLAHGVPFADLLATVRFVAPYAGYPASAEALAALSAIGAELGAAAEDGADAAAGLDGTERDEAAALYEPSTTDDWFTRFAASTTGWAWRETRLGRIERAYLALAASVAMHSFDRSFRRHVELALEAGATPAQVRNAVRFTSEFSVLDADTALVELDAILGPEPASTQEARR
ncbi:MAG TPA: carboxymuconolactone decarboxylase family protein [Streptosporangiales bacterium]